MGYLLLRTENMVIFAPWEIIMEEFFIEGDEFIH